VGAALIDERRLRARVRALAVRIRRDTPKEPLHLVTVLKGGFVFLADLVRAIDGPVSCDFLAVSSYADSDTSSERVRLVKDLDDPVEDRDVVIVEDILDTGLTLAYVQELVRTRRPRSLRTVCLLDKPARRRARVTVDYVGFVIDDHFVVGYGLDYDGRFRNLPYVAVLETGAGPSG
jgi:hypoxanthine phosphoribosyltransferase